MVRHLLQRKTDHNRRQKNTFVSQFITQVLTKSSVNFNQGLGAMTRRFCAHWGEIVFSRSLACVAGGFGGRESRAKTSGAAAGEMGREPRQSRRSRVNERLRREEPFLVALAPFPRGFATRFGSRAQKTDSYAG